MCKISKSRRIKINFSQNATNISIYTFFSYSDIFGGCSSLKDLSLAANFLRKWPHKALRPLAMHLHTLDMGENSLRELQPLDSFQQLYGLRLAGNRWDWKCNHFFFRESSHSLFFPFLGLETFPKILSCKRRTLRCWILLIISWSTLIRLPSNPWNI